ncbi:MAG: hypothetical protein AB7G80_03800 [Dongiaceae bacterium]
MANPKDPLGDFIAPKGPTDDISPERMAAEVYAEKVAADLADLGPGGKTRLQAELAAAQDRIAFLEGRLQDAQSATARNDQKTAKMEEELDRARGLKEMIIAEEKRIIRDEKTVLTNPYGVAGTGFDNMAIAGVSITAAKTPQATTVSIPVAGENPLQFDQRIDAAGFEPKIVKLKGDDGKLKTYELPPEKQAKKASAQAAQGERNKIVAQESTEATRKQAKQQMARDPQASVLLSATGALGKLLKDSVNLMDG